MGRADKRVTEMTLWVKSVVLGALLDVRFTPNSDRNCDLPNGRYVPCMDGARGAREKSAVSAKRSGAAMYSAFGCSRYGCWP
jgi:hypothetical protein